MAKGKHTTALFEVVSRNKGSGEPRGRGFLAPLALMFRPRRTADPAASSPAPAQAHPPCPPPPQQTPPFTAPAHARPSLLVDSDHHEVSLRLSYASVIISAFALFTVVGAAYLVGRKSTPLAGPSLAAISSDDLRQEPPSSSVLNVADVPQAEAPGPIQRQTQPHETPRSALAFGAQAHGKNRAVGLNYVVIQSYAEDKQAADAVKVLAENGIDATVERKLKGWLPSWYIVVGVDGFAKVASSPSFDAYIRKIKEISNRYVGDKAGKRPSFKAFDPSGYKWRAEDGK